MHNYIQTFKKPRRIELSRNQDFINGNADAFDLLAASYRPDERKDRHFDVTLQVRREIGTEIAE